MGAAEFRSGLAGAGGGSIFGGGSFSGALVNSQTALGLPAVLASVSLLSDMVALLPLELYRRTERGDVPVRDHPAHIVVNRPGDLHTSFELRQLIMTGVCLGGNGYARVHRSAGGTPVELEWLSPSAVAVQRLPKTRYLSYKLSGERRPLTRPDIVHIRALSSDGVRGMSPITLLRESIGTSLSQREAAARMMSQGSHFKGVLELPPEATPAQVQQYREEWERNHTGILNSGSVPMLWGLKFHQVSGMSAQDAQFIESRRFELQEIARAYRIPSFLIGDTTANTSWGSGIEQQNIGFLLYSLNPWLINFEQALGYSLLTEQELAAGYHFQFDREELSGGWLPQQAAFVTSMRNSGIFSPNDARQWLGYPKVDAEGMDDYRAPLNSSASGKDAAVLAAAGAEAQPAPPSTAHT